jgi:hypothetical protein
VSQICATFNAITQSPVLKQGEQMSLGKKSPKMKPSTYFVKRDVELVRWENVAHKFALLLEF